MAPCMHGCMIIHMKEAKVATYYWTFWLFRCSQVLAAVLSSIVVVSTNCLVPCLVHIIVLDKFTQHVVTVVACS